MGQPINGWGMLWARDTPKEFLLDGIDNAVKYYSKKYGITPNHIECSFDDAQKKFEHNGMEIVPCSLFRKGIIWLTNI